MSFPFFLLLVGIAYMLWRIMDQLPDVVFRLSEIQRDVSEIRRNAQQSTAARKDDAATEHADQAE